MARNARENLGKQRKEREAEGDGSLQVATGMKDNRNKDGGQKALGRKKEVRRAASKNKVRRRQNGPGARLGEGRVRGEQGHSWVSILCCGWPHTLTLCRADTV